jgi:hypothetical protein
MKSFVLLAGITAQLFSFSANADAHLDVMKKMNRDGCAQAIKFEEHPPKNSQQVMPYCT